VKFTKLAGVMVILAMMVAGVLIGCGEKQQQDPSSEVTIEEAGEASEASTETESEISEKEVAEEPGHESEPVNEEPKIDPGAGRPTAPDFTLADLSGSQHSLSDFRGKVVLLDFWATWCGPCRKEIPHLVKFYDAYSSQGFVILGVGLDKEANLSRFASEAGIRYIVLVDEKGVAGKPYGIRSIPRTLIIDKKGRIAFDHTGFPPGMEVEMEAEILTLLAEKY